MHVPSSVARHGAGKGPGGLGAPCTHARLWTPTQRACSWQRGATSGARRPRIGDGFQRRSLVEGAARAKRAHVERARPARRARVCVQTLASPSTSPGCARAARSATARVCVREEHIPFLPFHRRWLHIFISACIRGLRGPCPNARTCIRAFALQGRRGHRRCGPWAPRRRIWRVIYSTLHMRRCMCIRPCRPLALTRRPPALAPFADHGVGWRCYGGVGASRAARAASSSMALVHKAGVSSVCP